MGLQEKLRAKSVRSETVIVDGDTYVVTGKTKRAKGELFAKAGRKDGSINTSRLESILLEACVADANGDTCSADVWESVPSHITSPLVTVIMTVCGLDKDDIKKKSDDLVSTES